MVPISCSHALLRCTMMVYYLLSTKARQSTKMMVFAYPVIAGIVQTDLLFSFKFCLFLQS